MKRACVCCWHQDYIDSIFWSMTLWSDQDWVIKMSIIESMWHDAA